jgi:hypothetical protein
VQFAAEQAAQLGAGKETPAPFIPLPANTRSVVFQPKGTQTKVPAAVYQRAPERQSSRLSAVTSAPPMPFEIQVSNPAIRDRSHEERESLASAMIAVFPESTEDAHVVWNWIPVRVNYK